MNAEMRTVGDADTGGSDRTQRGMPAVASVGSAAQWAVRISPLPRQPGPPARSARPLQAMGWNLLGCGRRQRAVPAPNVCPISGQASPNGVCPISGQSTPSTASKPGAEAAKKAPPAVQKPALDDPLMGAQSAADAEMAQELKEQGNEKFRSKQYEEAAAVRGALVAAEK